jgi:hypothetical protein
LVKEELPAEDDASHCFVYDFAKNHGGWYLDGSCIELPFSWGLNVLSWGFRRFRLRVFERKRLPPFGSRESES